MRSTEAINLVEVVLWNLVGEVLGDAWLTDPQVDIDKLKVSQRNEADWRRAEHATPIVGEGETSA
jgi:hypothetical protein